MDYTSVHGGVNICTWRQPRGEPIGHAPKGGAFGTPQRREPFGYASRRLVMDKTGNVLKVT